MRALAPHLRTSVLFSSPGVNPIALAASCGACYVHPCWERRGERPDELLTPEWLARVRETELGIICWHEERPAVIAEPQAARRRRHLRRPARAVALKVDMDEVNPLDAQRRVAVAQALGDHQLPHGLTLRPWRAADFPAIQRLAQAEGWTTIVERPDDSMRAWERSWPALVLDHEGEAIGLLRALTDGAISCYVADVLADRAWRRQGLGALLLRVCQRLVAPARLDLLAVPEAEAFYIAQGFRPFAGFRRNALDDDESS